MDHAANPTPERREQIEDLFEQALELPPGERLSFLDQACGTDRELHREVESLLQAFDEPGPFDKLERDLVAPLHSHVQADPMSGRRVGPYRLVRILGYGGMGTVYLADRVDADFEQRVALKLVRYGATSTSLRQRFLQERQILARLEHPHIARFLDGGMAEPLPGEPGGQPYLAMEYIEGRPLTAYCDARRLSITERLRLFKVVCQAVHYAHQHLVVHRDLKPSNILVTKEGYVKLLDFGVAKLLTEEDAADVMTRTGIRVMTPEYAAPEQVRGELVTTATDVYGLGVVLYELLTGHRPYQIAALSPGEVERIICETEPSRPSTAVLQTREAKLRSGAVRTISPTEVSRARRMQPERLQRRLVGDLDVIVLKALAKEPDRRYASAEALMEDINRHLAGLPVQARGDTVGYRLRKFVQRHQRSVAVAALVVLLLLAGLAGTAWQAQRATRQAHVAQAEAEKARQVSTLMADLFEQADPQVTLGDTLTVHDLLAEGTRRVEQDLANQPDVQAALLGVLGRAYLNMGSYDSAQRLLDEALRLLEDGGPVERMQALLDIGTLYRETSDYERADSALQAALHLRSQVPTERGDLVGEVLAMLGGIYGDQADWETAEGYFQDALAVRQAHFGEHNHWVAMTLGRLADVATDRGDGPTADSLYLKALVMQRELLGPAHPDVGITLHHLSRSKLMRSDYEAGTRYSEEAVAIFQQVYGDTHLRVAGSLIALGTGYARQGDFARADSVFQEVLTIQRQLYDGDHAFIAHTLHNLALSSVEQGHPEEAETFMREAMTMRERLYGSEHAYGFYSLHGLATIYQKSGDYERAHQTYRAAVSVGERVFGERGQDLADVVLEHGMMLLDAGDSQQAEALLRRALGLYEEHFPPDYLGLAAAQEALGRCLTTLQQYDEAEQLLLSSFQQQEQKMVTGDEQPQKVVQSLIALYEAWGQPAQAEPYKSLVGQ